MKSPILSVYNCVTVGFLFLFFSNAAISVPEPSPHKSVFAEAQAHADAREYREAERIYHQEVLRLLAPDRKERLARVVLSLADELAMPRDKRKPDAPEPDYARAHRLYTHLEPLELASSMREELLIKKARVMAQAGNHTAALRDATAYLQAFDPHWSAAGHVRAHGTPRALLEGAYTVEARLILIRAQQNLRQGDQARWEAENLLQQLRDNEEALRIHEADLRWLIALSYAPDQAVMTEFDAGLDALKKFITQFPDDPRAIQAVIWMAEQYARNGRTDEAIALTQSFLDGDLIRMPDEDNMHNPPPDLSETPHDLWEKHAPRALYLLGQWAYQQQRHEEAIAHWERYVQQYPNGAQWGDAQNRMVDARFAIGMRLLETNDTEGARAAFETFTQRHPLDPRIPRIMFIYGRIHEAHAEKLEEQQEALASRESAYRSAIHEWEKLVGRFGASEEASAAMYRIGLLYEERLDQWEKALETYRALTWGSYAGQARQRIDAMTRKNLVIETERVFRTTETPRIKLSARNIEKVTVRVYHLDMEAYFRSMHQWGGIESLDVSLIEPDRMWTHTLHEYAPYKPLIEELEIPFDGNKPGAVIVHVSDDTDWQATTLAIRSDVDMILKSSRDEALVFAQNRRTGKVVPGARVLVSDRESIVYTGETGTDGVWQFDHDGIDAMRVLVLHDGHLAGAHAYPGALQPASSYAPKGYIYTDRTAYQPGDQVQIRGIIRDVDEGSYTIPDTRDFLVRIQDPVGRHLQEQPVMLSDFGSFHLAFKLPENADVGEYVIHVAHTNDQRHALAFNATFPVQHVKLEKIRLTLDFDQDFYFRGETVEATIRAAYYWDEPLRDARIRYTLPDGRQFIETADKQGELRVTFDTTPMRPGSVLTFSADVEGENIGVQNHVSLPANGLDVALDVHEDTALAGTPFETRVSAHAPGANPVGTNLTLYVIQQVEDKPSPYLKNVPGEARPDVAWRERTVQEHTLTTDAQTGEARMMVQLEQGGSYILRVAGQDRFGQTVSDETRVFISGENDTIRLRWLLTKETWQVGETLEADMHARFDQGLALITHDANRILHYAIVPIREGRNRVSFDIGHEHYPNITLSAAALDDRTLHTAQKEITVERELRVTVEPGQETYHPLEEATVKLTVTDQLGRPVRAELALSLMDQALLALYPDQTPDILTYFQNNLRRTALYLAETSASFAYQGITIPVAQAEVAEGDRIARMRQEEIARKQAASSLREDAAVLAFEMAPPSTSAPAEMEASILSDTVSESPLIMRGLYAGRSSSGRMGNEAFQQPAQREPARTELPDESIWIPSIITDKNGQAVVPIRLPGKTSAWRVHTRGVTPDTLVGQDSTTVLTRKDFFVSVKTPSFAREGDTLRLMGRVHNLTETEGDAVVTLTIYAGSTNTPPLASRTETVHVDAMAGAECVFREFVVPEDLDIHLVVTASLKNNLTDTLLVSFPVMPWGMEYAAHHGGESDRDETILISLPDDLTFTRQWMTLAVGPALNEAILDMALPAHHLYPTPRAGHARIFPPPSDWHDTTAGRLLGVAHALHYAQKRDAHVRSKQRLLDEARAGIAALTASQHPDGGWSPQAFTEHPQSDWATTSQAYWALVLVRDAGLAVDNNMLNKATAYLENQLRALNANDHEAKAVVLHALSVDQKADFAHINRLYRERASLGLTALAHAGLALVNMDRLEMARELAEVALSKQPTKPGAWWVSEATHAHLKNEKEAHAMALLLLAHTHPNHASGQALADLFLRTWGAAGSSAGQARGLVVAALAEWHAESSRDHDDYALDVRVNDHPVTVVQSGDHNGPLFIAVESDYLQPGENRVEFKKRGRGHYTYAASLYGFSKEFRDPNSWPYPRIYKRAFFHEPLRYKGRALNVQSTSEIKTLEHGRLTEVRVDLHGGSSGRHWIVEEPLPAGVTVLKDSIHGSHAHVEQHADRLVFYFGQNRHISSYRYTLVHYAPGTYRVPPTIIRDAVQPQLMRLGYVNHITLLLPGEKTREPYHMNDHELFALGLAHFEDGDYAEALSYLTRLFEARRNYNERDTARMLLWILTEREFYEPRRVVEMFEVLRERHPDLEIPFDKIIRVGEAYRDIGEFERAWLIHRAILASSFMSDSSLCAILEDEQRFMAAMDLQLALCAEYPDSADVVSAYFAVSQALFEKSARAHTMPMEDGVQPERVAMLEQTGKLLINFLQRYPGDPLADDAAFSLVNAFMELRDYASVVEFSTRFSKQFADTERVDRFYYMAALGYFWQGQHENALRAARSVADGESKNKDFATYIVGQIHHANGNPKEALAWYEKVADRYPDAAQSIAYFESKQVSMDEVSTFIPGEPVAFDLKYRNIKEAHVQVYRVDLMKLFLRERNLSRIARIQLAGIHPLLDTHLKLGDGQDYRDKEKSIPLRLDDEGAYLVIVRGDDLFASGLVLISPLTLETQEIAESGRVRVNVLNQVQGGYRANVHVKVIGSENESFISGETDLRGLFVADGIRGVPTIIARENDAHYAFHRSARRLVHAQDQSERVASPSGSSVVPDYLYNLRSENAAMQKMNRERLDAQRRNRQQGVQVQYAF